MIPEPKLKLSTHFSKLFGKKADGKSFQTHFISSRYLKGDFENVTINLCKHQFRQHLNLHASFEFTLSCHVTCFVACEFACFLDFGSNFKHFFQ